MNNELKRIEERLKSPAASEPPAGLLEKIQDDIPQYLRLISETAKPSSSVWRLRLVAASVVLVVVGGALVYRVSQQAPSLDERLDLSLPEVASVPEPASADQEVEEIESRPASESVAPGKLAASGETETQSARAPVASQEGPRMDATRERSPAPAQRSSAPPAAGVTTVTSERPLLATGLESEMRSLEEKQEPIAGHSRRLDRPASPSTGGTSEPNDAAYGDMFFRSYGTNPFVDTEDDGLSTFGLEVDTGSFTLMRSYLDRGHLPPHEAVRVEEFVNYFDYGDPAPRRGEFTLTAEGAPSPFATGARERLVRFGIKARELARADRESANLIFVVDVSGSMARENRLGLVRQSLLLLLDQLRHDDRIGVVIYGSRGEVLLEPTASKDAIRRAIERLVPSGSTNAEEGLDLAYSLARRHYREDAINRVILCSDGVANVGRTGAESILDRIRIGSDEGIELTTVGFGMGNFNDVLMEQLANQGDGSYVYVDTLEEARRIFVEKLTGTLQTIASDAKVQVEKYNKINKEIDEIKKELEILNRKIMVIASLEANRKDAITLLDSLTNLVVADRMWFTLLKTKESFIDLTGVALDNRTVADFMTRIQKSPHFGDGHRDVILKSIKQETIEGKNINLKK